MSIQSLLSQLGLAEPPRQGLEAQLHAMRQEVDRISRSLSRRAGHAAEDWTEHLADFGKEASRQGIHMAELAGEQAKRGALAVRRDPLPALAVLGTALLLARLIRR
ncbi:MAG: hypothetical protein KIT02_02630 [Devosia sp.]|uniref:hypothetical protein n=1 Tax=Devosia sp. TaxID=1871048 RepID=UPI0024CB6D16|nr:hypothetical protein [Devosia sp.]UYO00144.1 MAG: hypothetical protein KIT02_02630 [Devosia sp.]